MRLEILGFKQEKLIEYDISIDEALILRDIEDYINSGRTDTYFDEDDNRMYHWILYEKIISDIPILRISKKRLSRIFLHNLCERPENYEEIFANSSPATKKDMEKRKYLGLIKCKTLRNNSIGTKSYFAFTDRYFEIKEDVFTEDEKVLSRRDKKVPTAEQKSPILKGQKSPVLKGQKSPNKDIYINIYINIVEYLNEKAHKNYKADTSKTKSLIDARLNEGFTYEDFVKVIDTKCSSWIDTDMEKYLRPETLFGNKFEGYLNETPFRLKENETDPEEIKTERIGINRFEEL